MPVHAIDKALLLPPPLLGVRPRERMGEAGRAEDGVSRQHRLRSSIVTRQD